MKKVSVIGLFCIGREVSDGQSVKTRIVTDELEKILGAECVDRIDTYRWKKKPFRLLCRSASAVWNSRNVIFMTDAGGIRVFPWLLNLANIFGRTRVHYVVIGGWLVPFLKEHRCLAACLKRLSGIFVETRVMKRGLEQMGFGNVHLMPNCKRLNRLTEKQLIRGREEPLRFCIFSRVMKEKGIEDAVEAVKAANAHFGRTACTLDIFGPVDPGETDWFQTLSGSFPQEIRYCGIVPYEQSVETVKAYDALLFPTRFYTEGIPGTIIDAYAAGVPVVASRWESFGDIVEEGVTGIGYPFGDADRLTRILQDLIRSPENLLAMKKNCLRKSEEYLPEQVIGILLNELY